ncbi:MAG: hypothetical protein ACKVY0_07465 [Prosthecobacter sp.]|uniref:hypothetical protein n=1 Tax=Prosthecobacter sp. TaxID=1965333 RepID=UPI0039028A17
MSQPEEAKQLSPNSHHESESRLLKILSVENIDGSSCYERESVLEDLKPEWADSILLRDAVVSLLEARKGEGFIEESEYVRVQGVKSMGRVWHGDETAKAFLYNVITRTNAAGHIEEPDEHAWEAAFEALAEGWSQDASVRDWLCSFLTDHPAAALHDNDLRHVRTQVPWTLGKGWKNDSLVKERLIASVESPSNLKLDLAAVLNALGQEWKADADLKPVFESVLRSRSSDGHPVMEEIEARAAAIYSLATGWPSDPELQSVLIAVIRGNEHMTADPSETVRALATEKLGAGMPGDSFVGAFLLDIITSKTADGDFVESAKHVRAAAVKCLVGCWQNNKEIRKYLWQYLNARRKDGSFAETFCYARNSVVFGFRAKWKRDSELRDTLCSLLDARAEDKTIAEPCSILRRTVIELLAEGWPADAKARDSILGFVRDQSGRGREAEDEVLDAIKALESGWPSDHAAKQGLTWITSNWGAQSYAAPTAQKALERAWP